MMTLLSIATFILGLGLGFLVSRSVFQKKLREQASEALSSMEKENETKEKELMELKQRLADTAYRLSSLEKDYRSLKERAERS